MSDERATIRPGDRVQRKVRGRGVFSRYGMVERLIDGGERAVVRWSFRGYRDQRGYIKTAALVRADEVPA